MGSVFFSFIGVLRHQVNINTASPDVQIVKDSALIKGDKLDVGYLWTTDAHSVSLALANKKSR
jgi:hypothetical protein